MSASFSNCFMLISILVAMVAIAVTTICFQMGLEKIQSVFKHGNTGGYWNKSGVSNIGLNSPDTIERVITKI